MKKLPFQKRTLALIAVLFPLLALFVYVALRSGPLAPVSVVVPHQRADFDEQQHGKHARQPAQL